MALNSNVKPQKLAAVAAEVIHQGLVIPALITMEGTQEFVGAEDDTVFIKVPGYLPAHEITSWRAERTSALTLDAFTERKISVTFGGNTYSATKLQDEQVDYDLLAWSKVVGVQADAIRRNLEAKAVKLVKPYDVSTNPGGTPYEVTIAGAAASRTAARTAKGMRVDLLALTSAADKIRMPKEGRIFLVGTDVMNAMLLDDKIVLSQNTSESRAEAALGEASMGRVFGMEIIHSMEVPADFGSLFVRGAFVMKTAAPSVPQSVGFGATGSAGGVSVRFLRDYDSTILAERSVVNLYNGTNFTTDLLFDDENNQVAQSGAGVPFEYVIRSVAFDLDATADVVPVGTVAGDRADTFARITGVGTRAV